MTVAGAVLFDDNPQAAIPQASAKLYRYKSINKEGAREELAFQPITIEGPAVTLIADAVKRTISLIEDIPTLGSGGLESIKYPREAIHEVICNAVIHRDYSIHDYIHVRIFDNRVEIESPGRVPGPVTVENIIRQRFARNKKLQRLLSKFPAAPNKDVGEGLNTAFSAMRKLNLKEPKIEQAPSSVIVRLSHEPLASHEEIILRHLESEKSISNTEAREICFEQSDSKMRKLFKRMIDAGVIEAVPGTLGKGKRYRKARS